MAIMKESEIKEMVEKESYKYLENEYRTKNKSKKRWIKIQCNKGHEPYWTRLDVFKRGHRCEKCKNENYKGKWNKEKIIKYVEDEGYKFIRFIKFEKVLSRIEVECKKGHKYEVTFRKFTEGIRCPYCNESKGEKEVEKILNKYNIKHVQQYRINECKLKKPLPFDFYLYDYNCCIEFDGSQHYYISERFGGLDKFISIVISDTIKNEYCKKNNIQLIRIPFWDIDKVEEIIVNNLKLE